MGLVCLDYKAICIKFFMIGKMNNIGLIDNGSNPRKSTTFKRLACDNLMSKNYSGLNQLKRVEKHIL